MKKSCGLISAFAAVGVVLSTPAPAAQIGVPITETSVGGGPETLTVGFAGAIIGGTTDNWTITLPGITLSSTNPSNVWVEGAGDPGGQYSQYCRHRSNPGVGDHFAAAYPSQHLWHRRCACVGGELCHRFQRYRHVFC